MSSDDTKKPATEPKKKGLPVPAAEEIPFLDLEEASGGISDCCCISGCPQTRVKAE